MNPSLSIEISGRPIEQVAADLVAVGAFEDERPLRGAVSRVDWRLCGLVSEILASERFLGRPGDALLLPTFGRLHAGRVLILGLGPRAEHSAAQVEASSCDAVARALDLGARRLALSPPGVPEDEFPAHAGAVLAGAMAALGGAERVTELEVTLCLSDAPRVVRALEEACARSADSAVRLMGPFTVGAASTTPSDPQGATSSA